MSHIRILLNNHEEKIVNTFKGIKGIKSKEETIKKIILEFGKDSSLIKIIEKFK